MIFLYSSPTRSKGTRCYYPNGAQALAPLQARIKNTFVDASNHPTPAAVAATHGSPRRQPWDSASLIPEAPVGAIQGSSQSPAVHRACVREGIRGVGKAVSPLPGLGQGGGRPSSHGFAVGYPLPPLPRLARGLRDEFNGSLIRFSTLGVIDNLSELATSTVAMRVHTPGGICQ